MKRLGLGPLPKDTLKFEFGDDDVEQFHSFYGEKPHRVAGDHWKLIRRHGGWAPVPCDCTLEPQEITYYMTFWQRKKLIK